MKIIKLLIIAIILATIGISITISKNNYNSTIEKRIETLEKDLKNLRAELGKQRIIFHSDWFYSPIDMREMKTIQEKILRYFKLKYVKTPAQKKLIKRRWR